MTQESRRRPEPDGPLTPEVDALLAAARRGDAVDPAAERRALDAFRAAREQGAHDELPLWRRRTRDDWRPVRRRRRVRSVRAVVGGFAVAVTIGGVAVAAGSGSLPSPFGGGPDRPEPVRPGHSESATPDDPPARPSGTPSSRGEGGGPGRGPDPGSHPAGAGNGKNLVAHCRVYTEARGNGKAADATSFERLEAIAGGASKVADYCAALLAREPEKETGQPGGATKGQQGNGRTGNASDGKTGPAPEAGSTNAPGKPAQGNSAAQ
ncbi:hypothetical protein ACIBLA_06320 [Streptomyces sp. NPDC050433]|uniref:hypothetical protein n=1 Tax=Streptomyces sp. NPDC050433 TaxID=3365615 RepID=UPI0037ABCF17